MPVGVVKPFRHNESEGFADYITHRIAEYTLSPLIGIDDVSMTISRDDGIIRSLCQDPEPFLALTQCLLRLLALCDITRDPQNSYRLVIRVTQKCHFDLCPDCRAILT